MWCFLSRVKFVGLTEVMTGEYRLWVSASCSVAAWSGRKMMPSFCRMTLKKKSYSSVPSTQLTPRLTINDMIQCFYPPRLLHLKDIARVPLIPHLHGNSQSIIYPDYVAYIPFVNFIYSSIHPSIHSSFIHIYLTIHPLIHLCILLIDPSIQQSIHLIYSSIHLSNIFIHPFSLYINLSIYQLIYPIYSFNQPSILYIHSSPSIQYIWRVSFYPIHNPSICLSFHLTHVHPHISFYPSIYPSCVYLCMAVHASTTHFYSSAWSSSCASIYLSGLILFIKSDIYHSICPYIYQSEIILFTWLSLHLSLLTWPIHPLTHLSMFTGWRIRSLFSPFRLAHHLAVLCATHFMYITYMKPFMTACPLL